MAQFGLSAEDALTISKKYTEKTIIGEGAIKGNPGKDGADGADGADGKSAYQSWLDLGNTGTEEDFINSLKGEKGQVGEKGETGNNGKSAYDLWLEAGNVGSEQDFLDSLKGADGTMSFDDLTEEQKESLKGADGKSAYDIAVKNGFTGTEQEWLDSLGTKITIDDTVTETSDNAVSSKAVKTYVDTSIKTEIKTEVSEQIKTEIGDTFIPPSPTETERGGIKAKKKTTENVEVAIGDDDKLYVPGTDATLTDENKAANAKVTGDKIAELKNETSQLNDILDDINHNIPRLVPKDITSYYTDGTLWNRLEGTNGFSLFEDIFVGDYIKMSRAISAYNQDQTYQSTGSQYVTIAGIDALWGNGDNISMNYHHLIMIPGQGFGGTQHFGRSRMNATHTTEGGYVGSEMYITTIGAIATEGSTETTATINQQLYAEFGSHLKTTRELLSNAINSTGYNRFGSNTGCSNNWSWYSCQAVLMSEIEVYGSIVWSSSGFDTGNANKQLPLFVNSKQAINNRSAWYWLKDVTSASHFCGCDGYGGAYCNGAGRASDYVRPRFVIAA